MAVIAFELTILFGVLSTVIGLFINARLPNLKAEVVYDPEFSSGRFGLFVEAAGGELAKVRDVLSPFEPEELREVGEGAHA